MSDEKKKAFEDGRVKGLKVMQEIQERERSTGVELQVLDTDHARSEEVLRYCIGELQKGSTWNTLRRKLGLGHAGIDGRWRVLKDLLTSAVMPETEEEAFKAMQYSTASMVERVEALLEKLHERTEALQGAKEEPQMYKAQIDAMKLHMEAHQKRFEHFLKMRELKMTDRKGHGASIIYQQNFLMPRPGDQVEFIDGKPMIKQVKEKK